MLFGLQFYNGEGVIKALNNHVVLLYHSFFFITCSFIECYLLVHLLLVSSAKIIMIMCDWWWQSEPFDLQSFKDSIRHIINLYWFIHVCIQSVLKFCQHISFLNFLISQWIVSYYTGISVWWLFSYIHQATTDVSHPFIKSSGSLEVPSPCNFPLSVKANGEYIILVGA